MESLPFPKTPPTLKMFYPAVQWISIRHPSSVVYCTIPSAFHSAAKPVPSEIMDSLIHSFIHSFIRFLLGNVMQPGTVLGAQWWAKQEEWLFFSKGHCSWRSETDGPIRPDHPYRLGSGLSLSLRVSVYSHSLIVTEYINLLLSHDEDFFLMFIYSYVMLWKFLLCDDW